MTSPTPYSTFEVTLPATEYFLRDYRTTSFTLRHHVNEPYALTLVIDNGYSWEFDRSMLVAGVSEAVGEGNVRVFPVRADISLVGIAMRRDHDGMVLITKKDLIEKFLICLESLSPLNADRSSLLDAELENFFK